MWFGMRFSSNTFARFNQVYLFSCFEIRSCSFYRIFIRHHNQNPPSKAKDLVCDCVINYRWFLCCVTNIGPIKMDSCFYAHIKCVPICHSGRKKYKYLWKIIITDVSQTTAIIHFISRLYRASFWKRMLWQKVVDIINKIPKEKNQITQWLIFWY